MFVNASRSFAWRPQAILAMVLVCVSFGQPTCAQSIVEIQQGTRKASDTTDVIAVLGAFPEELRLLRAEMKNAHENTIQGQSFTTGELGGRKAVIALTGIGKVNAATTTMLAIEHFRPEVILFTGIAGGINPDMKPGDIVIGTRVAYHDYGTLTSRGMQRGPTRDPVTHAENPTYFVCDSAWLTVARQASQQMKLEKVSASAGSRQPDVREGVIVTGDVFVASDAATHELRENMHAEATEMEGAAVAQVSFQQGVPFLIIRSMSDNAGNNASHDVKSFYAVAARNSAALVMAILQRSRATVK